MAQTDLRPNANISSSGWDDGSATFDFSLINEDIETGSPDADFAGNQNNNGGAFRVGFTATPGDFGSTTNFDIKIRARSQLRIDDNPFITLQLFDNGGTQVGSSHTLGYGSSEQTITGSFATYTFSDTGWDSLSAAQLDGAELLVTYTVSNQGMPDSGIQIDVSAVEGLLDYNTASITGVVNFQLTFGAVTSAKVGAKGAVVYPLTFDRVTTGKIGAKGQVVYPLTFDRVVNGVREVLGIVALPLTFGVTSTGTIVYIGRVDLPLLFNIFTDGNIPAGGGVNGSASFALTFTATTSGLLTARGAVALPLTLERVTTGVPELLGVVDLPLVLSIIESGKVDAKSAVDLPLLLTILADGFTGELAVPTTEDYTTLAGSSGALALAGVTGRNLSAEP